MFKLSEMFVSLEGEGTNIGYPELFVRFQGCNINCSLCDTQYAQDFNGGRVLSYAELVGEMKELLEQYPNVKRIHITGGEPLQQDKSELALLPSSFAEHIFILETSGMFYDRSVFDAYHFISMDLKNLKDVQKTVTNVDILNQTLKLYSNKMQIKSPVSYMEDYVYARSIYENIRKTYKEAQLIITPGWYKDLNVEFSKELADLCIKDGFRMIVQQHKVIWGKEKGK